MPAHSSLTRLAALALAATLILPWPAAAQPSRQTLSRAAAAGASASPSFLAQAWGALVSLWGEIGCGLDPDGACAPASAEIGCGLDPSGLCAPAPDTSDQQDIGCLIDPNGAH